MQSLHRSFMLSKSSLALVTISSSVGICQLFADPALAGHRTLFFCDTSESMPVTKVRTSRGDEEMIRWTNSYGNGFTTTKRCQLVTQKLQTHTNRGRWFLTSRENINGMPVICAVSREGENCTASTILVTLPRGANAGEALQQLNFFRSGVNGNDYINLGQAINDINGSPVTPNTPGEQSSSEVRF
jgi:hypothetical protein